jgi:hypothetical protein
MKIPPSLQEFLKIIATLTAIGIAPFVYWVATSSLEASAYNRITGKNVSTWDAMWVRITITP